VREVFTDVGGVRVRHLEAGSGPAVLLMHGASLGSSADVWSANLADLAARGLRAIAPDLPGFGLTEGEFEHSVGYRTAFVPRLLDALRLERAHLVGHSQSGRIAVMLALNETARVGRIVVLGTGSMLPPRENAKGDDAEPDETIAQEPSLDDVRRILEANVFDRSLVTEEAVAVRHRMSTGRNFQAHLARKAAKRAKAGRGQPPRGQESTDEKPLWQRLDEVPVPLRLVYGRQDRAAEPRVAAALTRYPALDIHLVDRCGHLVQWDARERFAELAGSFLTG